MIQTATKLIIILAVLMSVGCAHRPPFHLRSIFDGIRDVATNSYDVTKSECMTQEWLIVNREGTTEDEDLIDLAKIRAQCDAIKVIFDQWYNADQLARTFINSHRLSSAINVFPDVRWQSNEMLRLLKELQWTGLARLQK